MAITRFKASSIKTGEKYVSFDGGLPNTPTIGTATDGGTGTTALVAFTANNTAGLTYTALSNPDSLTASSTLSPITVTGLTTGTAYTFTVKATNSAGDSPASAASNSVTPVSPSSYESIATAVGTGSSGTITFSSIPSTYSHLQIRGIARSANASTGLPVAMTLTLNGNTTAADYITHELNGTGSTANANSTTGVGGIYLNSSVSRDGVTAGLVGVCIIDLHDYTSSTKNKTIRAFTGYDANDTNGRINLQSGLFINTSTITSLSLTISNNFTTATVFSLYGIKA